MDELKPCPCGKTPTEISVYAPSGNEQTKWAFAVPDCCGEWNIEFRNQYNYIDSPESKALAVEAWNDAPRASPWRPLETLFDSLRMSRRTHLGLGDIRLTLGQQEEILKALGKKTDDGE